MTCVSIVISGAMCSATSGAAGRGVRRRNVCTPRCAGRRGTPTRRPVPVDQCTGAVRGGTRLRGGCRAETRRGPERFTRRTWVSRAPPMVAGGARRPTQAPYTRRAETGAGREGCAACYCAPGGRRTARALSSICARPSPSAPTLDPRGPRFADGARGAAGQWSLRRGTRRRG